MGSALVENWRAKMQPVTDIPKNVRIIATLSIVVLMVSLTTLLVVAFGNSGKGGK